MLWTVGPLRAFSKHHSLVSELARREFQARYRGSVGGIFWSFAQPLFTLCVYTVVFGVILQARWGLSGDTKGFAFMIFAGLIVYNAFSECLIQAPRLIVSNPNYVKKIVFPLEVLPWVQGIIALTHALIGWLVWVVGHLLIVGTIHPTSLLFPLLLVALLPMLLGVGWLFSALGMLVRDTSHLTGILAHALLFVTPVFFSLDVVPPQFRLVLTLNPLTLLVEQSRAILFFNKPPDVTALGLHLLFGIGFSGISLLIFRRLRPHFADLV